MKRPAEEGLDKLDGAKKPIFLTKAERLQISRKEIGFRTNHASSSHLRDDRERRRERDRSACTDRDLERGTYDLQNTEEERKKVLELYLSSKEQDKRRVVKFNDQRRFCFDWDGSEDTSLGDKNDLYGQPHQAGLLFGRGFRAGIDKREQKKQFSAKFKNDNRHWSQKKLNEMTDRDWRIFKEDFDICYKGNGSKIPHPMRSWDESHLTTALLKAVDNAGYKNPSPIQMAAIPLGLRQRDLIATAQTGSGKTAAFVLPMLSYVSRLEQHEPLSRREESGEAQGPYALVLAPTRELAQQIEVETTKFARFLNIRIICIVGGHDQRKERQSMEVAKGCEVVIATPGRLLDCLESHYLVLNRCNYVVLDEADRMIDMGFEPQVRGILDAMPSSNLKPVNNHEEPDDNIIYRTTHMFSATMPPTVERLARKYLRNPVVVNIGTTGQASRLTKENVLMIKESEKMSLLQKLLQHELRHGKTAIVFVNTHRNADKVSNELERANYLQVTTLHGQMRQEERRASLDEFRSKRCPVLVATDVAGRGIDIPDVGHVINYEMPSDIQAYTHRIGRTGRAGKEGLATTFLTLNDKDVFYDLKQKLNESKSRVPPELANHPASQSRPGTIADRPPRRKDKVYAC